MYVVVYKEIEIREEDENKLCHSYNINMGGTKCKIDIKKLEKKDKKSVTFSKRKDGLFRKASELGRLSPGTQIAILATSLSSNAHSSFYSFGHSSVDHVVSSLLHDRSPSLGTNQIENMSRGLGFWWEDESFDRSENVDELKAAVSAASRMLNNVRLRLDDAVKSNQRDGGLGILHQEEEEVLQLCNEEATNQIPKIDGETSGYSSNLINNQEDNLHIDGFFTDFKIDPF